MPRLNSKMRKTTSKQFEILVDYLRTHIGLEMGLGNALQAKTKRNEMWLRLTDKLNGHGPPVRSCAEWKRTWCDYKYNLKRKLSMDLKFRKRPGCDKRLLFSKTEQRVICMLGFNKQFTNFDSYGKINYLPSAEDVPDPLTAKPSLPYNEEVSEIEVDDDDAISNDLDSTPSITIVQPAEPIEPVTTKEDVNVLTMLNDTLVMIQKTQLEVLKELKESNRQRSKMQALKERLIHLEQEKLDEKKQQNFEKNKQGYITIELQRKELELYELKLSGSCKQCTVKNDLDS